MHRIGQGVIRKSSEWRSAHLQGNENGVAKPVTDPAGFSNGAPFPQRPVILKPILNEECLRAAGILIAFKGQGSRQSPPSPLYQATSRGCIAQLVEQLTLNQRAVGSNPTAPTNPFTDLARP